MTGGPTTCRDCDGTFSDGDDVIEVLRIRVGTMANDAYAHASHYRNDTPIPPTTDTGPV